MRVNAVLSKVHYWAFLNWKRVPLFSDISLSVNNLLNSEGLETKSTDYFYAEYAPLDAILVPVELTDGKTICIVLNEDFYFVNGYAEIHPSFYNMAKGYVDNNYTYLPSVSKRNTSVFVSYVTSNASKSKRVEPDVVPEYLPVYSDIFSYVDNYNQCTVYYTFEDKSLLVYCVFNSNKDVTFMGFSNVTVPLFTTKQILDILEAKVKEDEVKEKTSNEDSIPVDELCDFAIAANKYLDKFVVLDAFRKDVLAKTICDLHCKDVASLTEALNNICKKMEE